MFVYHLCPPDESQDAADAQGRPNSHSLLTQSSGYSSFSNIK